MTRMLSALSLAVLGLAGLLMGCGGETAAPGDTSPPDSVHMVPPDGEGGRYWPRWRGPSGQGVVEAGEYPDTWSDTMNKRPSCMP